MNDELRERFSGIDRLYGQGAVQRHAGSRVAVVGMGGVGSWVVEALVRSGIGHLTLIDADDICVSNTNRQLPALAGQYGRNKAQAMAERCRKQNTEFTGRQAWLGRVRQLLASQLHAAPGLDRLAEQLNCSSRTLRRHLHDLGSSYQELLDELRFERAKQWLAEDAMPIHCIAVCTLGQCTRDWPNPDPTSNTRPAAPAQAPRMIGKAALKP